MSFQYRDQRVAVFIDAQNIYHSAKNLFGRRVNFGAIVKTVVGPRKLIRAFAYVVKSDVNVGEIKFFEALEKIGIQLRIKELQVYPGGMKKADWDVGLAVDAVKLAPLVDTIVIVSGDGDFIPLVEYLKNQGKQLEIAAFGKTTSSRLKEETDMFYDLGERPQRFLLGR